MFTKFKKSSIIYKVKLKAEKHVNIILIMLLYTNVRLINELGVVRCFCCSVSSFGPMICFLELCIFFSVITGFISIDFVHLSTVLLIRLFLTFLISLNPCCWSFFFLISRFLIRLVAKFDLILVKNFCWLSFFIFICKALSDCFLNLSFSHQPLALFSS
jgi:hypothetical protein